MTLSAFWKIELEKRRKVSWWGFIIALFFIGISLIEITALNTTDISKFERIFWWVCLLFWIITGTAIAISKWKENKK